MAQITFPKDFLWGTATSAYQIEGGSGAGERGRSIWDEYAHTPGRITDGSTGDVACDHYHRYREDVALIRELGTRAYRFSVAWPRVIPGGKGGVNRKGLDFYQRLVDCLLENGIIPFITLYHWDLPLELYRQGGWASRDTSAYFADFCGLMAEALGDRVKYWMTLNEPFISVAHCGYQFGIHAPGLEQSPLLNRVKLGLLLAHGRGFRRIKAVNPALQVGVAEAIFPADPLHPEDAELQELVDSYFIYSFFDPVCRGTLPPLIEENFRATAGDFRDTDLEEIRTPLDFVGLTNYTRFIYTAADSPDSFGFKVGQREDEPGAEFTEMGWEVYPEGIYRMVRDFTARYGKIPIYISENGAAFADKLEKGRVDDPRRVAFLQRYLAQLARAVGEGCDVRGYFLWSLLDNFEWSQGYTKRFGIVYVDFPTGRRIPKSSYAWYREVCREGRFSL